MKQLILIFAITMLTACGPSSEKTVDETLEVTSETSESIKEAQNNNSELEEIDGELDSLLNKLN
jgi:uncharacterized protein YcfL